MWIKLSLKKFCARDVGICNINYKINIIYNYIIDIFDYQANSCYWKTKFDTAFFNNKYNPQWIIDSGKTYYFICG